MNLFDLMCNNPESFRLHPIVLPEKNGFSGILMGYEVYYADFTNKNCLRTTSSIVIEVTEDNLSYIKVDGSSFWFQEEDFYKKGYPYYWYQSGGLLWFRKVGEPVFDGYTTPNETPKVNIQGNTDKDKMVDSFWVAPDFK